ncbi:MAG: methyltransferase domain-containing protein [Phycisphaeraceae bacterium]|nr:methyltransferase domain-containing protein [Phycisphaeraceae bacterium]MCW5762631.1 methyltransferase domain-containing protein [Phycisphaeraceae bacterium]
MEPCEFVSRGGLKLRHALTVFAIDVSGLVCVDLGCSTGGFTDCLLRAGAERVYAVDTGYGVLDWKLRNDPRVRVIERANALHVPVPVDALERGGVDLAVIDLGWTRQMHALPAAARWLCPGGRIITLIKPHYEQGTSRRANEAVLADDKAEAVLATVLADMAQAGFEAQRVVESPIRGGKKLNKGNREWLALVVVEPTQPDQ